MINKDFIIELKKTSDNNINIKTFIHLGNGDYTESINGFTISKKTLKELVDILNNNNITSGNLKNIKINNGDDKISFEYEGTEREPRLYLYNDEHNDNGIKTDGGLLRIPLEPELFWGKSAEGIEPKNIKLLIDELRKYV